MEQVKNFAAELASAATRASLAEAAVAGDDIELGSCQPNLDWRCSSWQWLAGSSPTRAPSSRAGRCRIGPQKAELHRFDTQWMRSVLEGIVHGVVYSAFALVTAEARARAVVAGTASGAEALKSAV